MPQKNTIMPLYKATVKITQPLPDGSLLEKGMSVQFSYIGVVWDGNGPGTQAINDAFLRVYGIDLKTNFALHPGYIEVERV